MTEQFSTVEEAAVTGAEAVVLVVLLTVGLTILVYTIRTGVPPMPMGPGPRSVMLRLVPRTVDGTIYDLGSGWGGLALRLADRYPHNRVVGIELSPVPWLFACVRSRLRPRPNLEFRRADFMAEPLRDAGTIVCYLMPAAMRRLGPKLATELHSGAVVVSYGFALDGWPPDAVVVDADTGPSPAYRYVACRPPGTPLVPPRSLSRDGGGATGTPWTS